MSFRTAIKLLIVLSLLASPAGAGTLPANLKDCVRFGLEHNPSLKAAEAKVNQARARTTEVQSAQDFKFSTTGSYVITTPEIKYALPSAPGQGMQDALVVPNQAYNLNFTLSRFLTNFGLLENQTLLAALQADGMRLNYWLSRRDLIHDISVAYLEALRALSLQRLARQTLLAWQDHLAQTRSLFDSGVVSKYDVLRGEVEVSKASDQVTSADKAVSVSQAALKSLMGIQNSEPWAPAPGSLEEGLALPALASLDLPGAQKAAVSQRLEMRLMDLLISQSEALLKIAQSGNNPSLSLGTTYSARTATFMMKDWQWQAYLNLNFPLFTGRERPARLRSAQEAINQAKYSREDMALKIGLEVESTMLAFNETAQRHSTAGAQLSQAEEGLRVAELRYEEGLSTGVERMDAQTALTSAKSNLENTRYDYWEAALHFAKAIGQMDEDRP